MSRRSATRFWVFIILAIAILSIFPLYSRFKTMAAPIPPGVHLAGVDLSHLKDLEEIRAQLAPPLTQPLGVRFRDRILVLRPEEVDFRPDVEGTIAAAGRYLEGPDFVDIALREAIGLPQQVRNVPLQFTVDEGKVRAWLEQQAQERDYTPSILEGTEMTAIFDEDGTLSGSAGCNNYVTGYTTDGSQISIGPAASTMMLCPEPEGIMEQEAAYLAALATAATYSINGQVLEMRTADDAMAVRFEVATDSVVAPEAPVSADPDPVAADTDAAPIAFAAAAAQTPTGRVTAPLGVNIRVGPGTQFPIVGVAPLDTTGEIVGRSADDQWWAARVPSAPNEQGWVAAAYVEASDAENVPVLPAPPLPRQVAPLEAGTPYPITAGRILYSASRVVQDGNRVYELEDIYAVASMPGAQAEMVANNAQQPALSPDRQTLAFYSQQSDKLGVGGYDVNTGRRLRFSRFIEDSQPRWSPTGDRIVFASNRQGDRRWRIYITPAVDKENPSNMDYTELDFGKDPDWHPSQELLILKGCDAQGQNCGLYTMGTDGANRTQLTNVASDSLPRWFPDGSAVVFMSEDRDGNWELYRANAADGVVTRLTNDPAPDGLPAVSPDGRQIAFFSKRSGAWGLWTMPAAGGDATQITAIPGELPDWLRQSVDWPR